MTVSEALLAGIAVIVLLQIVMLWRGQRRG